MIDFIFTIDSDYLCGVWMSLTWRMDAQVKNECPHELQEAGCVTAEKTCNHTTCQLTSHLIIALSQHVAVRTS